MTKGTDADRSRRRKDAGQEPSLRLGLVPLPVPDVLDRDAKPACNLALEQPEVEPALPEVVTQRPEFDGILGILRFFSP